MRKKIIKQKSLMFVVPLVVYPFDILVAFNKTDEQVNAKLKRCGLTDIVEMPLSSDIGTCEGFSVPQNVKTNLLLK